MQSTDPGGVAPPPAAAPVTTTTVSSTNPFSGTHSASSTPNVTSPTAAHTNGSGNNGTDSGGGANRGKGPWGRFQNWTEKWRGSRQLVLVIVAIALLLDNMLLTVVGK